MPSGSFKFNGPFGSEGSQKGDLVSGKTTPELYNEFWPRRDNREQRVDLPMGSVTGSQGSLQRKISAPRENRYFHDRFKMELDEFIGFENHRYVHSEHIGTMGLQMNYVGGQSAQESFIEFMNHRADIKLTNKSLEVPILSEPIGSEPISKIEAGGLSLSTPLQNAVLDRNFEKTIELLKGGVDSDEIDICDTTALHYASMSGYLEEVGALLDYGASLKVRDFNGETPLHLAAEYGHFKVAKELLNRGASVIEKNNDGKRPFDLAKTDEMRALLKYDDSPDAKESEEE